MLPIKEQIEISKKFYDEAMRITTLVSGPRTPFRPLHNQVVIRVLADDSVVTSLWIPETANNKRHSAIGQVVAVGQGHRRRKLIAKGENPQYRWLPGYCPMDLKLGDYVVFARFAGEAHKFEGKPYMVTPVEHIYAVLDDYDFAQAEARPSEFSMESYLTAKHGPATRRAEVLGKHGT